MLTSGGRRQHILQTGRGIMWIYLAYVVVGLVAGFASTLFGVGGGIVVVPMLLFLGGLAPDLQVDMKVATVTSLAYMVPIAVSGAWQGHASGYHIKWLAVILAVPGGLLGTYLGNAVKKARPSTELSVAFGVFIIIIGVRLVLTPWFEKRKAAPPEPPRTAIEAPSQPDLPSP